MFGFMSYNVSFFVFKYVDYCEFRDFRYERLDGRGESKSFKELRLASPLCNSTSIFYPTFQSVVTNVRKPSIGLRQNEIVSSFFCLLVLVGSELI